MAAAENDPLARAEREARARSGYTPGGGSFWLRGLLDRIVGVSALIIAAAPIVWLWLR